MINKINQLSQNSKLSKIRIFNEYAKKFENTIFLTLGEPCFDTPQAIKDKAIEGLNLGLTKYTPPRGTLPALKGIQKWVSREWGLHYETSEIIITAGSTAGILATLSSIIEVGDEIIVPMPAFPGYAPLIQKLGGKIIEVDTSLSDFQLEVSNLEKFVTPKTKAIIINYPNNPTGVSLNKKNQQDLAEYIKNNEIFLISDEVYNSISYDDEFISMALYPEIRNKTIIIQSFSKSHAMTGWRLGFILCDQSISNYIATSHQYLTVGPTSFAMYPLAFLDTYETSHMRIHYQNNLDIIIRILENANVPFIKPQGTFYLFIKIKDLNISDEEFCYGLIDQEQVAIVPGSAFGPNYSHFVRLSFANTAENVKNGAEKLVSYINRIKKTNACK